MPGKQLETVHVIKACGIGVSSPRLANTYGIENEARLFPAEKQR
jgi:hypothetical protein